MKIVYENITPCYIVHRVASEILSVHVRTVIIKKHHWFFGLEWDSYHIKQYVPYIPCPTYDAGRDSNKKLSMLAKEDKCRAKYELLKLKSNL